MWSGSSKVNLARTSLGHLMKQDITSRASLGDLRRSFFVSELKRNCFFGIKKVQLIKKFAFKKIFMNDLFNTFTLPLGQSDISDERVSIHDTV